MSKLQELIQKLCPDGVEYKRLGDVCEIKRGVRVTRSSLVDGGAFSVFQNSLTPLGNFDRYNRDADKTFVICAGAAGEIGYSDKPFWAADDCFTIEAEKLHNRYVYHFLLANKDFLKSKVRKASVPRVSATEIGKLVIPIPHPDIQEEIVRILDNFTNLAAELQAELQARQEQYEYYRNKLLTFNNVDRGYASVTWMKMSEIGTFIRGNGLQKKDFTESGVPCIHYGQIYTHYGTFAFHTKSFVNEETAKKCKKAHTGDLVFATVSENVDDVCKCVAWLGDEEICISGDSLAFCHNQNPKYLAYYFQTAVFADYKRSKVTGTKVIRLHQSKLEQFIIPVPSLIEQEHIVSILDKFETLVKDFTEGLPAEMAAVQEQYEYYRNKLLSFPRTKISA